MNSDAISDLLDEFRDGKNQDLWNSIHEHNFKLFCSILSDDSENKIQFSMDKLITRLIHSTQNKQQFFEFLIQNNGNFWWNIKDYSVIIAYCVHRSDFKTLDLLFTVADPSDYNLLAKFTERQIRLGLEFTTDTQDLAKNENEALTKLYSILDICVQSKFINFDQLSIESKDDNSDNYNCNYDAASNNKSNFNDNYKCFQLLARKMHEMEPVRDTTSPQDEIDYPALIYHCFANKKGSFVECIIENNLCDDYSIIINHVSKYPAMWKLGSMRMLLHDYTNDQRRYSIFAYGTDPVNCLGWCLNIGLEPLWMGKYRSKVGTFDEKKHFYYSKSTIDAAFECFKIILTSNAWQLDNLVNTLMNDGMHIAEICASNCKKHPRFINFLIENNGKYGWTINFNNLKVLTMFAICGNYNLMRKLINSSHCSIEGFVFIQQVQVDEWKRYNQQQIQIKTCESSKVIMTCRLNDFAGVNYYAETVNHHIKEGKRAYLPNLLFWCIEPMDIDTYTMISTGIHTKYKNKKRKKNKNKNGNGDGFDVVVDLSPPQQLSLCMGYLRDGGIEYPDNIGSILIPYIDRHNGKSQCFKYLMTHFVDQFALFPTIVRDCAKLGLLNCLECLYNMGKKYDLQIRRYGEFYYATTVGSVIDILCQQAVHIACFCSQYYTLKFLLDMLKQEAKFHINSVGDGQAAFRSHNEDAMTKIRQYLVADNKSNYITPLLLCAKSSFKDYKSLKQYKHGTKGSHSVIGNIVCTEEEFYQENLNCLKLLLKQPKIDVNALCFGGDLLAHCIRWNKFNLVEYLIDNYSSVIDFDYSFLYPGSKYKKNIKIDFHRKYDLKEFYRSTGGNKRVDITNGTCLHIAIMSCITQWNSVAKKDKFRMLKLLFKNHVFLNDEIVDMSRSLLMCCINSAPGLSLININNQDAVYECFKYLISGAGGTLIDKGTFKREKLIKISRQVVDLCERKNRIACLSYIVQNSKTIEIPHTISLSNIKDTIKIKKTAKENAERQAQAYSGWGGACWSGNAKVLMSNGDYKQCKDIKIGDKVTVFPGKATDIATVTCTVVSDVNQEIEMCCLKHDAWITFEHPILMNNNCDCNERLFKIEITDEMRNDIKFVDTESVNRYGLSWALPKNVKRVEMVYQEKVFNFMLDQGHCILVNEHWCCTLGHNLKGDVIEHELWGNSQALIHYLSGKSKIGFQTLLSSIV